MQARRELTFGLAAAVLLGALLVERAAQTPTDAMDLRLSTYRSEPNGAKAWAQAVEGLGRRVSRWERPLLALPADQVGTLFVVLAPDSWLDFSEQLQLTRWVRQGGDLLVAGGGLESVLWCNGWRRDSMPSGGLEGRFDLEGRSFVIPKLQYRLGRVPDSLYVDSTRASDLGPRFCRGPRTLRVDTLLRAPSGSPIAVRSWIRGGGSITIVADAEIFTNRAVRRTPAGEFALSLVPGGTKRVLVDEYVHDFGSRGSLLGAILAWSSRDPLGWGLWQVVVVGMLALVLGGVRTGPLRKLALPSRRAALEHVQALARTLGASRGHDVAIALLVRGLRRRLSATGRAPRDGPRGGPVGTRGRARATTPPASPRPSPPKT